MNKPPIDTVRPLIPEAEDLHEIGFGGFKVVYSGRVRGVKEALKLIYIPTDPNDPSVRDENLRRAKREISLLGDCSTPLLVKMGAIPPKELSIGGDYFVLYSEEFLEGESIRQLIKDGYRADVGELATLAWCLLQALKDLKRVNTIHRDIKPDNVIKTNDPNRPCVLFDLGIAYVIGGTQLTREPSAIPGTIYYLAPEMLDQAFRDNLDYRADLYTVGLTLYEFASLINPFRRPDSPFATLYRIKTETPLPLRQLRPDLPAEFCAIVDQLIKKLPALRPANLDMLLSRMGGLR